MLHLDHGQVTLPGFILCTGVPKSSSSVSPTSIPAYREKRLKELEEKRGGDGVRARVKSQGWREKTKATGRVRAQAKKMRTVADRSKFKRKKNS